MAVWSEATAPSCYDHTFAAAFQPLYIYMAYERSAPPPPVWPPPAQGAQCLQTPDRPPPLCG